MTYAMAADELTTGITKLLEERIAAAVSITTPHRVFGGNARQAWTFTATWQAQGSEHHEAMIVLVRSAASQVSTEAEREFVVLDWLSGSGVRAPKIWAHDPDGRYLSESAVVLERLPGSASPVDFLHAELEIGRARTLDLARALAELHAVPSPPLPTDPRPLQRLRSEFEEVRSEPYPGISWVFDWLEDHQPDSPAISLVHGDFRVGNVLFEKEKIVGILDWELAHVGDPLEDIAWAYRALWSPRKFLSLDDFVAAYQEAGGVTVEAEALRWHRVHAELRFAVISLRGSRAFLTGASQNLRVADRARTVIPSLRTCLGWLTERERTPC